MEANRSEAEAIFKINEVAPAGLKRFASHLNSLFPLLNRASITSSPALNLYQSPARQWLFYLEALARIYRRIHNPKRFELMRIAFKKLEDQLGRMDYYDGFIKEFSVQKGFPAALLENLKNHFGSELDALGKMLNEEEWIAPDSPLLNKFRKKLESAKWRSEEEDRSAVGEQLMLQIDFVESSYKNGPRNFNSIEQGVHEFRRQLRWISIYAQALDGLIQLKAVKNPDPELEIYLTKETLENPYNKLPELKERMNPIYIQAPHFYALSWLIGESGKLKDEGLRIICIENSLKETNYIEEKKIRNTASQLAGSSEKRLKEISDVMKKLVDDFINNHKILKRIKKDIKQSMNEAE